MSWFRRHGLDDRFMLLVVGIMAAGIFFTAIVAGLAAAIMNGNPGFLFGTAVLVIIGGGIMIPVALLIGLLPSAVIFIVTLNLALRRHNFNMAVQWAATVMTVIPAMLATGILAQDADGAGALMLIIGPASVVSAPWITRKIYR